VLGLILAAQSAMNPTPAAQLEPLEEIVVTGERIARTLGETASSVAVTTAPMLEAAAAPDRLEQILAMVPNVQLGSGGEGATIRGQDSTGVLRELPAFLGGTRPRATLTIDGRSASYNEYAFGLASIWDVERIEVFRSPQTTTQGRNSIAGAIFIETRDPSFEWERSLRVLEGNYATRQVSGALSGPIVDKQLAFRLSGDVRRSRTSSRITSRAIGADANRDEFDLLRFKLSAAPKALSDSTFELTYSHVHSEMPQIEGIEQPFRERRNPNAGYGIFGIQVDSLTGVFEHKTSERLALKATASVGDSDIRRFAPAGLGENEVRGRDHSFEALLDWTPRKAVRLTGGVHYLGSSLSQTTDLTAALLGRGTFADRQHSVGVFGETNLVLAPKLTLTAGLRYQWDEQRRQGGLDGAGAPIRLDFDRSFDAWLPKASLAYDLTENGRIGLLAQRAYNPGGVSINLTRRAAIEFEAETLWDYEAFVRATLLDNKLSIRANVFHYDMVDSQRSLIREFVLVGGQVARFQEISNAPRARSQGLEAQVDWRVNRRLSVGAALGVLATKITATPTPSDPMLGNQFQRAPRLSAAASIDWRPLAPLRLSAQLRYHSSYFSDDAETALLRIGGSTTLDAKASYRRGPFTVFGYVRNVFDKFHLTSLGVPLGRTATAGDPREFGLGLEVRY
jgi:iron complex outermembrane recepter protein